MCAWYGMIFLFRGRDHGMVPVYLTKGGLGGANVRLARALSGPDATRAFIHLILASSASMALRSRGTPSAT